MYHYRANHLPNVPLWCQRKSQKHHTLPINPADIAAWYDFSDPNEMTVTGNLIDKVNNKQGTLPALEQSVTASKPTFIDNGYGFSPHAAYFDGVDDFMDTASFTDTLGEFTVFIAALQVGTPTNFAALWMLLDPPSNIQAWGGHLASTITRLSNFNSGVENPMDVANGCQVETDTTYTFINTSTGILKLYRKAALLQESTASTFTTLTNKILRIGRSLTDYNYIHVTDIIVLNKAATIQQINALNKYINGKFLGIPSYYPANIISLIANDAQIKHVSGDINTWKNLVDFEWDAKQTINTKMPTYEVGKIYSKNVVTFDRTDDYLEWAATPMRWFENMKSRTISIVVVSRGQQVTPNALIIGEEYGFASSTIKITNTNLISCTIGNYGVFIFVSLTSTTTLINGFPTLVTFMFEAIDEGYTGAIKLYINGILESTNTFPYNPMAYPNDIPTIGMFVNSMTPPVRCFNGHVCEIQVCNVPLDDNERGTQENYLMEQYGVGKTPVMRGLVGWYEAINIDNQLVSVPIAEWPNLTGLGNLIQEVGSKQPIFEESGINNVPTVNFDGSNDDLYIINDNDFVYTTEYSVMMVVSEISKVAGDAALGGTLHRSGMPKGGQVLMRATDDTLQAWHLKADGTSYDVVNTGQTRAINTPFIMGDIGTLGILYGRTVIVDDTITKGTLAADDLPNTMGVFTLGNNQHTGNMPGNFRIGIALYYNVALTNTEIEENKNYLRKRMNM